MKHILKMMHIHSTMNCQQSFDKPFYMYEFCKFNDEIQACQTTIYAPRQHNVFPNYTRSLSTRKLALSKNPAHLLSLSNFFEKLRDLSKLLRNVYKNLQAYDSFFLTCTPQINQAYKKLNKNSFYHIADNYYTLKEKLQK